MFLFIPAVVLSVFAFLMPGTSPRVPDEVHVAAPRIIMLYDGALKEPVYLTNWRENLDFMSSLQEATGPIAPTIDTTGAFVEVALFWYGPTWDSYAKDPAKLKELDPNTKGEIGRGRIFLGQAGRPPVLIYQTASRYRVLGTSGVRILRSYQVPITK